MEKYLVKNEHGAVVSTQASLRDAVKWAGDYLTGEWTVQKQRDGANIIEWDRDALEEVQA